MSGIKRFDAGSGVNEWANGRFVRFTDHEQVVAELQAHYDECRQVGNDMLEQHEVEIARLRAELSDYQMAAAAEADEVDKRGVTIKELRAEADALRKDAERYRWLRDLPQDHPSEEIGNMPGDMWDEMIDAAMGADA